MRIHTAGRLVIPLGVQGENLAQQVRFPVRRWVEGYGEGTFRLLVRRPGDTEPYAAAVTVEEEYVVWTVTAADTARAGMGRCELQYSVGEALAKSWAWVTRVEASLGGSGEDPPEPEYPVYGGATEVTPAEETQVLATAGTLVLKNITVNPIPPGYGKITWNGAFLTVS